MTSYEMPTEMRMPVRMVGAAAASRMTVNAVRSGVSSSVLSDCSAFMRRGAMRRLLQGTSSALPLSAGTRLSSPKDAMLGLLRCNDEAHRALLLTHAHDARQLRGQ